MSQFNPLMSAQANPAALHLSQFQHLQRLQANQRILGNKLKNSTFSKIQLFQKSQKKPQITI